jgi:hypothetical protein
MLTTAKNNWKKIGEKNHSSCSTPRQARRQESQTARIKAARTKAAEEPDGRNQGRTKESKTIRTMPQETELGVKRRRSTSRSSFKAVSLPI